jgi:hypothetical protein
MKTATMSKDGEMRITISIKHRASKQDIVNAIGWQLLKDHDFCDAQDIAQAVAIALKPYQYSAKKMLEAFKNATASEGSSVWTWREDCTQQTGNEIIKQAGQLRALCYFDFNPPK